MPHNTHERITQLAGSLNGGPDVRNLSRQVAVPQMLV